MADRTTGPWPAWRTDGVSAARQAVRLRLSGGWLVVTTYPDDRGLESLDARRLRLAEEVYDGQPMRLLHPDRPGVRYTVADPFFADRLDRLVPGVRRRHVARHRLWRRLLAWSAALVLLVAGLFTAVPLASGMVARALPEAWVRSAGELIAGGITAGQPPCDGAAGREALEGLLRRLDPDGPPPRLWITGAPVRNALAAPGGHIVLFRGLVDYASGPGELAGVLAHELAHVRLRHPTEGVVRQVGHRLLLAALLGDAAGGLDILAGAGEVLLGSAYSRAAERAADRTAVAMLNEAGMDSTGLAALLERFGADAGDEPPRLLASHPLTGERVGELRGMERQGEPPLTAAQWRAVQRMCE